MTESSLNLVGWASACALVLTIAAQVFRQWRAGRSDGVSVWLFIGQLGASLGFIVYSGARQDWVFVVANACGSVFAILGLALLMVHRRRARIAASRTLLQHHERRPSVNRWMLRPSEPPPPTRTLH